MGSISSTVPDCHRDARVVKAYVRLHRRSAKPLAVDDLSRDRVERAHARRVRWLARMTWPIVAATLFLVLGPARLSGTPKVLVIATMLGAAVALNLPSLDVVRRALREGAPRGLVGVLGLALGLRVGAALALAVLLR
jgi:hypothetical protein